MMTYPLWHPFTADEGIDEPPLRIVEGHGSWLVSDTGQRLINGFSGLSVICGLGRAEIIDAIGAQLHTLASCSVFRLTHPAAENLAERLARLCFAAPARTILVNSGAEAVEGAVKVARQHFALRGQPDKRVVFTFDRSYHGCSMGTMGMSGLYSPQACRLYGAARDGLVIVAGPQPDGRCSPGHAGHAGPCGDRCLDGLSSAIADAGPDRAAAVVVEPVLAAGGVIAPSPGFFDALTDLCRPAGMLVICDESASGLGRTGHLLGAHRVGLRADIVILAKALSGGYLPIGAVVAGRHVFEPFARQSAVLSHGSSSSGSPPAAAAALAVLDIVEKEGLPGRASGIGEHLMSGIGALSDHPRVAAIRQIGLMTAVEVTGDAGPVYQALLRAGVITHVRTGLISFFPPLTTSREEIQFAASAFVSAFNEIK